MSKVTIGVPFYNNDQTLSFVIESILNQTFQDWELILLDDGSVDNSLNIASRYCSEKIKVISDGVNKGLIFRLNQLIEMTDSMYFTRMDADDIMHPQRLEKQIHFLINHQEIDLVGSGAYIINEENMVITARESVEIPLNRDDIGKAGLFIHPTVTGKTEWFKHFKYREGYDRAEDLELWYRSFDFSNFAQLKEPLLFYRDPETINLKKYYASHLAVMKIFEEYIRNEKKKMRMMAKEKTKLILYRFLIKTNKDIMYKRFRNNKLQKKEYQYANHLLNQAISKAEPIKFVEKEILL